MASSEEVRRAFKVSDPSTKTDVGITGPIGKREAPVRAAKGVPPSGVPGRTGEPATPRG